MNFNSNVIKLHFGLEKPIRILHITDAHLSLADDVDGDEMKAHAAKRRKTFFNEAYAPERDPVGYLEEAMEYSKDFDCTVITGDLLDFTSHANREIAKKILAGKDYMFCPGSHEFCPKVGVPDSWETKDRVFDEIQALFRGNMTFESRIVGGVNVITMDNSYYTWTEEQFEKLKFEVSRGLPCLIFCHSPLTNVGLNHELVSVNPNLILTDEVKTLTYKMTDYIVTEPMIKAVFSGHWHANRTEQIGEKTGYILGSLVKGIVGEIVVV